MNSPFPGMDPFLERSWTAVHHHLLAYATDQLQPRLPDDLRARTNERVFVDASERVFQPDVLVAERRPAGKGGTAVMESGAPVAEPLIIRADREPFHQKFIEILDITAGRKVITVIEFLSPSNKLPGKGRKLYRQKQRECIGAGVNLVEIDLTRRGRRRLLVPRPLSPARVAEYEACVWRAAAPTQYELYEFPLRKPLPAIRLPLRPNDPDVPLDLQSLVDEVYRRGRYDDIDYASPLSPPLATEDQAWLTERLAQIA